MLSRWLAAALMLQSSPQEDANKAAAELLKKVEEKAMNAKTLHVEFEAQPAAGRTRGDRFKGELRIGEGGAFLYRVVITRRQGREEEIVIRSDGRAVTGAAPRAMNDLSKFEPASVQKFLRRTATLTHFLGVHLAYGSSVDPERAFEEFAPSDVRFEGKEKVGEVEATTVSFVVNQRGHPNQRMTFKLWIDPASLSIVKRFLHMGPESFVEFTPRFELNAAFPADFFEFQTAATLQEGLAIQLARAVGLHARFTGRLPKTLEDLKRRPADLPASVFWPDGGFWIGGAIPKDIPYSADAGGFTVGSIKEPMPLVSPVGAPTDRLRKFFTARVAIDLLQGAAHGYSKAHTVPPKTAQDLVKKPDSARYWPEGGWIGGGSLPLDPWGDAYQIRTAASFSASVAKPKGRMLRSADLTPEERNQLDLVALPPLDDKDAAAIGAIMDRLNSETLADREAATKAIVEKGAGVLRAVSERMAAEKDPEVVARLGAIRNHFKAVKRTWESEMKGGRFSLTGTGGDLAMIPANELGAMRTLKTFTTAQADFRSNDRDGNRMMDFYTRDVAGLYALKGASGRATEATPGKEGDPVIRLIEPTAAMADATEGRWEYPILGITDPEPKSGYLFASLKHYEDGGNLTAYHDGNGRTSDKFGFVAYPAEYGVTGRRTFLVNEANMIWSKDLAGEDIDTFPANPAESGWARMD